MHWDKMPILAGCRSKPAKSRSNVFNADMCLAQREDGVAGGESRINKWTWRDPKGKQRDHDCDECICFALCQTEPNIRMR